jgi:methionyl-tRNA formyltransferase
MNIVFLGTPSFAVPSLERLLQDDRFRVLAVVTQPDKRRGRGSQMTPSPVKALALTHQIPVWQPDRIKKDADTLHALQTYNADAFVVVAYGQILSPTILAMPRLGCINAHGSLLPQYRGAAPIQWSLYNGESETGITTMLMDAGMDTGPMLLNAKTPIDLLENAQNLADRLAQISADLLVETLIKFDRQEIQPCPQDQAMASHARLIQKEDYGLDWSRSALALHNQVRGFYPNCFTTLQEHAIKVLATVPLQDDTLPHLPATYQDLAASLSALSISNPSRHSPGTIVHLAKGLGPIVQTGVGWLLLLTIQAAGKRPQSGWDFVNGNHLTVL